LSSARLAIDGGAPIIGSRFQLRRYQLQHGIARSYDLMKTVASVVRGTTSIAAGADVGIVARVEREFCQLTGARYSVAMNSGTASLHSAYFAVGVGPGSEVIVPAYTWHATATPILLCGAKPVFCEIDPETLNADPEDIERRITERTRAVCVLHAWGNPAEMDRILEIADRHHLYVIEDCSHAHGARYRDRSVGSWGHVGCFSLQGSKAVDGGEAGIAVTDDPELYDRMILLGHNYLMGHGAEKAGTFGYGDISLGVKYRPHLAAMYLAHASLGRLERRNQRARRAWNLLCEELRDVPCLHAIAELPGSERGGYYFFVFDYRGEEGGGLSTPDFVAALKAEGVPVDLDEYRDALLHTLPVFTQLDRSKLGGGCYDPTRPLEENLWKGDLPVTEQITRRLIRFQTVLWAMPDGYVRRCAQAVKKVLAATLPVVGGTSGASGSE